jgi:hypothetical protein
MAGTTFQREFNQYPSAISAISTAPISLPPAARAPGEVDATLQATIASDPIDARVRFGGIADGASHTVQATLIGSRFADINAVRAVLFSQVLRTQVNRAWHFKPILTAGTAAATITADTGETATVTWNCTAGTLSLTNANALFEAGTGALSGTSGNVGKITLSAYLDGNSLPRIDVENRATQGKVVYWSDIQTTDEMDWVALQNACILSPTVANRPVKVDLGLWRLNRTLIIPSGLVIMGLGGTGNNNTVATNFLAYHDDDCVLFDGSYGWTMGTGSGMFHIFVYKGVGFGQGAVGTRGTAIKIIGGDTEHRPGEHLFICVAVIPGTGGAYWDRGFVIDGSVYDGSGTPGIRTVRALGIRATGCSVDYESIVLNSCDHSTFVHLDCDQAGGPGVPGLMIKGESQNIDVVGSVCYGRITVDGTYAGTQGGPVIHVQGKASQLIVNNPNARGRIEVNQLDAATTQQMVNKSPGMTTFSNLTPMFHVKRNTNSPNVTGDGTALSPSFDNEIKDLNNDFTAALHVNVVAGRFLYEGQVTLTGILAAHTTGLFELRHKNISNTVLETVAFSFNPFNTADATGRLTLRIVHEFDMAYTDRCDLQLTISGGTKVINIIGDATTSRLSFMQGRYVGAST